MSQILGLYRLQSVDTRLDQANTRLENIRAVLENNSELQAARTALELAKNNLREAEKSLKTCEDTSESQRIKLEQVSSSLYGGRIQNPKELQDLQNDLASLKRHLASLEDKQLEAMLELESSREAYQIAEKNFLEVETKIMSQNAYLRGERDSLLASLQSLQTERSATNSTIPPALLQRYENLRQKRRGLAVATISDNACDACGAGLIPAQAQAVRMAAQLVECPSCGRFLFSN